MKRTALQ